MPELTTPDQRVILYMKPGCHLCDEARDLLEDLAATCDNRATLTLVEIDIRRDPECFALYRYRIPVIAFAGEVIAEGRIVASDLYPLRTVLRS